MSSMCYETARLFIRPFDYDQDFENSVEVYGDARITTYFDHQKPRSREEIDALVRDIGIAKRQKNPTVGLFTILDKVTKEYVGQFDFIPTGKKSGEVEIGYIIRYDKQGKGYGTEIALSIINQYGAMVYEHQCKNNQDLYDGAKIQRLIATMHPDNTASVLLSQKMGMVKISEMNRFGGHPRHIYAIDVDYSSCDIAKAV